MIKERSQEILLSKTFLNTIKTKFNEEYLGLYNIDSESDEYTKKHTDDIARKTDKKTHYQWSLVFCWFLFPKRTKSNKN